METINLVFLILLLADAIVNVIFYKNNKVQYITSPMLIPLILLYYGIGNANPNILLIVGAVLGWVGDVCLMPPQDNEKRFMVGLGSFLLGHVIYIVTFIRSVDNWTAFHPYVFVGFPLYLIFAIWIAQKVKDGASEMLPAIIIYMIVIEVMSFTALIRASTTGSGFPWFTFIGSMFFIASDTFLAWDRFKSKIKGIRAIAMSTYIVAQFLIVQGFL